MCVCVGFMPFCLSMSEAYTVYIYIYIYICVCVCVCVCVAVCCSVISSSFKSCHRPDTIVRRGFHRLTSDVPVIQSNYTERNRYCYTQGIDSRQNRKVKIRLHSHLRPCATCSESHTLLLALTDLKSHGRATSISR